MDKGFIEKQIARLKAKQVGSACWEGMCGHRNIDKSSQCHGVYMATEHIYQSEIKYYLGLLASVNKGDK